MNKDECGPKLPPWLVQARRENSLRHATMTPQEVADDINRRGQRAAAAFEARRAKRTRHSRPGKAASSHG